jgi:hypothetical protein
MNGNRIRFLNDVSFEGLRHGEGHRTQRQGLTAFRSVFPPCMVLEMSQVAGTGVAELKVSVTSIFVGALECMKRV